MHWLGYVVALLAFVEGGWIAFDGCHAFAKGDYVTPKCGLYAGQLGPWSKLVTAVGIEPRSTLMKSIHVVLGLIWVAILVCYLLRLPWAWTGMLICAIGGLWYLPFGTLLSIAQIVLLLMPPLRTHSIG